MNTFWQVVVVALIGVWAAGFAFLRLMPGSARQVRLALAGALDRPGRPGWLRAPGRWLRPPAAPARGCGSGCASCSGCGPSRGGAKEAPPHHH